MATDASEVGGGFSTITKQLGLQGGRLGDLHTESWIDEKSAAVEQATADLALQGLQFLSQ